MSLADINITPRAEREFDVRVRDREGETSHRVTVPQDLIEEFGLPATDLEAVVRESFKFLLERELASSIMSEFSLDVIARYFPDYPREPPGRL